MRLVLHSSLFFLSLLLLLSDFVLLASVGFLMKACPFSEWSRNDVFASGVDVADVPHYFGLVNLLGLQSFYSYLCLLKLCLGNSSFFFLMFESLCLDLSWSKISFLFLDV